MRRRGRRKDRQPMAILKCAQCGGTGVLPVVPTLPMATSEAGGIVPQELRERLIALFSWMNEVPIDSGSDVAVADDVLAEIAVAGFRVVPADWIMCVQADGETMLPGFDPDQYDLDRGEGRE
jgi:hypothetical protein